MIAGGHSEGLWADDRLPGVPRAGVRHGHNARDVVAIDLHVKRAALLEVGDRRSQAISAPGGCIDGEIEPLAWRGISDAVAVGASLVDVHALCRAVLTVDILWRGVVIGDAFAAGVEVLGLNPVGGNVERRPME